MMKKIKSVRDRIVKEATELNDAITEHQNEQIAMTTLSPRAIEAAALRPIELEQMTRLARGENIASSDRASDGARTRLKKHGLISFDRKAWLWRLTDAGHRAMLTAAQNGGEDADH